MPRTSPSVSPPRKVALSLAWGCAAAANGWASPGCDGRGTRHRNSSPGYRRAGRPGSNRGHPGPSCCAVAGGGSRLSGTRAEILAGALLLPAQPSAVWRIVLSLTGRGTTRSASTSSGVRERPLFPQDVRRADPGPGPAARAPHERSHRPTRSHRHIPGRPCGPVCPGGSITTGKDTLLRLIRALRVPQPGPVPHLGADEFAVRRGRRYATILVDMTTHRPVDVLTDRTAETSPPTASRTSSQAWSTPAGSHTSGPTSYNSASSAARPTGSGCARSAVVSHRPTWSLIAGAPSCCSRS